MTFQTYKNIEYYLYFTQEKKYATEECLTNCLWHFIVFVATFCKYIGVHFFLYNQLGFLKFSHFCLLGCMHILAIKQVIYKLKYFIAVAHHYLAGEMPLLASVNQ